LPFSDRDFSQGFPEVDKEAPTQEVTTGGHSLTDRTPAFRGKSLQAPNAMDIWEEKA